MSEPSPPRVRSRSTNPGSLVVESRQLAGLVRRLVMLEDGHQVMPVHQRRLLAVVAEQPGIRLRDLAASLGEDTSSSTCSRMLDRVVVAGWAAKTRPGGGRELAVTITPAGTEALRQVDELLAAQLQDAAEAARAGGRGVEHVEHESDVARLLRVVGLLEELTGRPVMRRAGRPVSTLPGATRRLAGVLRRVAMLEDGDRVVTLSQQRLLVAVEARPGLKLNQLAATLGLFESNCCRLLDRVVEHGHAVRTRPTGRSLIAVTLTPAGARVLQQLDNALATRLRAALRASHHHVDHVDQIEPAEQVERVREAVELLHALAGRLSPAV